MQQGQKPHKSKRLNPPQFNGNSCGNLLRLNKALLRCNRLHPVLDRRSAPKAGTDVATDSCQPCRNVFQLRFDVVKRDENSAHPKRDCADKNPVFSAKRSPIDHVQPLSVVGHESTTRDFRREAAGLQASPPPSSESLRVPPPEQAARAAGRSNAVIEFHTTEAVASVTRIPPPDVADKGGECAHLWAQDQPLLHGMELTAASTLRNRPAAGSSPGGCGCGIYCQDIGGGRCRYERAA